MFVLSSSVDGIVSRCYLNQPRPERQDNMITLAQAIINGVRDTIGVSEVKTVIESGGVVFAYPRKKQVRLNGGRARPATDAAVKLAYEHAKAKAA